MKRSMLPSATYRAFSSQAVRALTRLTSRQPEQSLIEVTVQIREVLADLCRQIDRLDARTPGRIERRRGVMSGKPVIAGTRIPTASIWRQVKEGLNADDVRKGYPGLTKKDIDAAVAFEERTRASPRT